MGCRTLDVGSGTLDVGRWTLDVGRWTLDVGRWTFGIRIAPSGPDYGGPWMMRGVALRRCAIKFGRGMWDVEGR